MLCGGGKPIGHLEEEMTGVVRSKEQSGVCQVDRRKGHSRRREQLYSLENERGWRVQDQ